MLISNIDVDKLPIEMTAEWQLCDLVGPTPTEFSITGIERLQIGLEKAGLDARTFTWPPDSDPNRAPYRGLRSLSEEDAAMFFGRDSHIVLGLDKLRGLRENGYRGLLVILGASGAGKSSFLRAGLIPRLCRDDRNFLVISPIRPQSSVITGSAGLAQSLHQLSGRLGKSDTLAAIEKRLERPEGLIEYLVELHQVAHSRVLSLPNENSRSLTIVLCIDQAEELFDSSGLAESTAFLNSLQAVVNDSSPVQVIVLLTIRTDRHSLLQQSLALQGVERQLIDLPPMPVMHYKDVILGPANRFSQTGQKLEIDHQLLERLLSHTSGADALPILAFTLEQLYRRYGSNGRLELSEYEELESKNGGVIAAVVEEALKDPHSDPKIPESTDLQDGLLRELFSGLLISIDPNTGVAIRQQVKSSGIDPNLLPMVNRLVEARVLTKDVQRDEEILEIAHDSVLDSWGLLRDWIKNDRPFLIALNRIETAQKEWQHAREDKSFLIPTGSKLAEAEDWIAESRSALHMLGTSC